VWLSSAGLECPPLSAMLRPGAFAGSACGGALHRGHQLFEWGMVPEIQGVRASRRGLS